mmetsp:Transcript_43541/g.134461  ORF Transcript_43541/g.134461 Transcript_43541/m.134461 type:complete len:359 (-) Transcript_43541:2320-3396(-)
MVASKKTSYVGCADGVVGRPSRRGSALEALSAHDETAATAIATTVVRDFALTPAVAAGAPEVRSPRVAIRFDELLRGALERLLLAVLLPLVALFVDVAARVEVPPDLVQHQAAVARGLHLPARHHDLPGALVAVRVPLKVVAHHLPNELRLPAAAQLGLAEESAGARGDGVLQRPVREHFVGVELRGLGAFRIELGQQGEARIDHGLRRRVERAPPAAEHDVVVPADPAPEQRAQPRRGVRQRRENLTGRHVAPGVDGPTDAAGEMAEPGAVVKQGAVANGPCPLRTPKRCLFLSKVAQKRVRHRRGVVAALVERGLARAFDFAVERQSLQDAEQALIDCVGANRRVAFAAQRRRDGV